MSKPLYEDVKIARPMNDNKPDTLLPCPFCGGEAAISKQADYDPHTDYIIECRKCFMFTDADNYSAVIKRWNTRQREAEVAANAVDDFVRRIEEKVESLDDHYEAVVLNRVRAVADEMKREAKR